MGVLVILPITLEGKIVNVEVEVVDAKLNYNLLLGHSWTHAILCIPSTLFRLLKFPHEGKIITFNHLSLFTSSSENNVPYVDQIPSPLNNIGPYLFKDPALMGVFPLLPPNTIQVNMIFRSDNPWIIPLPEQVDSFWDSMSLTPIEINYCELLAASDSPPYEDAPSSMSLDIYYQSPWLGDLDLPHPLKEVFQSDESIVETMSLEDLPWSDGHHHSLFMPCLRAMSNCL